MPGFISRVALNTLKLLSGVACSLALAVAAVVLAFELAKQSATNFVLCLGVGLQMLAAALWKASRGNRLHRRCAIAASVLSLLFVMGGMWGMRNPPPFRFEHYATGEEARAALMELHPLGSEVEKLLKRLNASGVYCGPVANPDFKGKCDNLLFCKYIENEIVFSTDWSVSIWYSQDAAGRRIMNLQISSYLNAL
jgi:hypothetical protein